MISVWGVLTRYVYDDQNQLIREVCLLISDILYKSLVLVKSIVLKSTTLVREIGG